MNILLIEDDAGDQKLVAEALKMKPRRHALFVAKDGQEGVDFLFKHGVYAEALVPDLILLDLNLPKIDGWEILRTLKQTPHLKRIPVVVFSTSNSTEDRKRCYDLFANCFICKPNDLERFFGVIGDIEEFWSQTVILPTHPLS